MFDPEIRDQLLIMKRYLPLILGGAILLAGLTYFLQTQATPVYGATSTVHLEVDVVDDGLVTDFQAAQFTQIMSSPAKLREVAERSGLGGLSITTIEERLTVDQRSVPGFIDFTATGPDAQDVARLANTAAEVLVETVAASRLATAEGSSTAAVTIAEARVPEGPIGPRPRRDGVLAGLISLIVLAQGSVLFTKIRGRVSLADPAGNVQRATGVPTFTIEDEDHYNQAVMPMFVNSLAQHPSVLVVQRGSLPSRVVANQIANSAGLVGRSVALQDANLGNSQFVALDPLADFTVASVTSISNESEALLACSRLPHAVVLVCDPNSMPMAEIESLARTIPGVGGNLVSVILNEPTTSSVPEEDSFAPPPRPTINQAFE